MIARLGSVLIALFLTSAAAYAQTNVPYASGGIGVDDMQRLTAREKDFNLKLVFTLVEGNYLSDIEVAVKDATGKALLAVTSEGPVLLAKLPRGSYLVEARYEGKSQIRKVGIGDRLRTEYLRWQSNPETDFPGPKATEQ